MQKFRNPLYIVTFIGKEGPRRAKKTSRQIVAELKSRGINAEVSIKAE